MAAPRWRLVTFDIDGTLTLRHGWATIAAALGRTVDYEAAQARFRRGETDEDEHLRALLDLAAGAPWVRVETALAVTPRLGGIRDGLATLRADGARVALLTHNPPYLGDWYRREFGFDDFEGCEGPPIIAGTIGPTPPVHADKKSGLRALADRSGARLEEVVHVGDGAADAARFPEVGRGISVNAEDPRVERAADVALRTTEFGDVVRAIRGLGPRR